MARPTTKNDLLAASAKGYESLWALIDSMSEEMRTAVFTFEDRDRNVRDVLIHLYEWHQLLLNWVAKNQKGERVAFLPNPYNWKTYGEMNVELWQKHQDTPYEKAEKQLKESHKEVMDLIEGFSNDALFSKNYFDWTGTTTLGSYCVSASASHYDWAMKKIKKHIKLQ